MSDTKRYPEPFEDDDNRPFLEAWKAGRLSLPHCRHCDKTFYYPRCVCPYCWGDEFDWLDMSGEGRIVSFSLVYRPNDESFNDEVPIVLAEIELAEDVSLISRVVCDAPEKIASGMEVHLVSGAEVGRYPLPTFEPV